MANHIVGKKKDANGNDVDVYDGLHESTQTFGAIGLLEAAAGDVVLRGRQGERDHLYPLELAVKRHDQMVALATKMCRYGVNGWDTLLDITKDMAAKIKEAVDQRASMNRETPADVLEWVARQQSCS